MTHSRARACMKHLLGVVLVAGLALAGLSCRESETAPASPTIAGCQVLPADNPWNLDISKYPVHPNSDAFIASIGTDKHLHPDFGTVWQGAPIGIPYVVVRADQPKVPIDIVAYPDESDAGPFPLPLGAPIEGGPDSDGDRHVIALDVDNCKLYEIYRAFRTDDGWKCDSAAVFDLTSNELRPMGWTSADAAGLPIFPGLVRYEEVEQGAVNHALRFTVSKSQRGYILPATHFASRSSDANLPPMGLRVRLKADYDISGFPPEVQLILKALKKHGMIVADNGGDWYISGAPDSRWDDEALSALKQVEGKHFEVVDTGSMHGG